MRFLAFIVLAGCVAAPNPALVTKLARVALAASARQYGLPASNPEVIKLAKDNLEVSATAMRHGFPPSEGPEDPEVGRAIANALPPHLSVETYTQALDAASRSLPGK